MYITFLSFGVRQCLIEGSYCYAHLGAACGGYTSAATIQGAMRIQGNTVYNNNVQYITRYTGKNLIPTLYFSCIYNIVL